MKVLVNGIGNIGSTLLYLLQENKEKLNIETVFALKNTLMPWHESELAYLQENGVVVCTRGKSESYTNIEDVLPSIEYIFDCTNNGGGIKNKEWYSVLPNLKGASAQGSEKDFGISFMTSVNDDILRNEKYAHIVSCNTHSIASLLSTFSSPNLNDLVDSDFVIVRRSEDIGNHQRLVSANVVARHLDDKLGTHHSIDVLDLYKTINVSLSVTSSDITTPSQLMHGVRFNISLANPMDLETIKQRIEDNPWVSYSTKFDSNVIFERGRRISPQGRIYSHAIIIANNILQKDNRIMGWAFIPQEGNTLLSTIHAFLLQTNHPKEKQVIQQLRDDLIYKVW